MQSLHPQDFSWGITFQGYFWDYTCPEANLDLFEPKPSIRQQLLNNQTMLKFERERNAVLNDYVETMKAEIFLLKQKQ